MAVSLQVAEHQRIFAGNQAFDADTLADAVTVKTFSFLGYTLSGKLGELEVNGAIMLKRMLRIVTAGLVGLSIVQSGLNDVRAQGAQGPRRCASEDRDPSCQVVPPPGSGSLPVRKMTPQELRNWQREGILPVHTMTPEELRDWNAQRDAEIAQNHQAAPALPSVDVIRREMKGNGALDAAARISSALHFLGTLSEQIYVDRQRAGEYLRAQSSYAALYPQSARDPQSSRHWRFSFCLQAYEKSAPFLRAFLDKDVPDWKRSEGQIAQLGHEWQQAVSLPPQASPATAAPSPSCTAEGPFNDSDQQAEGAAQAATQKATEAAIAAEKKRSADQAARAVKRSRAEKYIEQRKLADEPAKQAAMADAQRARTHKVDTVLWGVPLGSPLTLPDCDTVGEWEDNIFFGKRITTKTTCMLFSDDGAASVVWAESAFPSWANDVTSVVKNDVLVSVKIAFMSAAVQTGNSLVGTGMRGLVNGVGDAVAHAGYEAASKEAEANVEGAHKYLRAKYGKASRTSEAETKDGYGNLTRSVKLPEWDLHGLCVRYAADVYRDTVTIRLDSADE